VRIIDDHIEMDAMDKHDRPKRVSQLDRSILGELVCLVVAFVGVFGSNQLSRAENFGFGLLYFGLIGGAFGLVVSVRMFRSSKRASIKRSAILFFSLHLVLLGVIQFLLER
jgi:hypothetical protein